MQATLLINWNQAKKQTCFLSARTILAEAIWLKFWSQVAAEHFGIQSIHTFSGGTESTACNIRTIRALRRAGLSIVATSQSINPIYLAQFSESFPSLRLYSKVYSDEENPRSHFAAIMCCADADKSCPDISGADVKFALNYEDPKIADDTPSEAHRYDERSFQIAQEMFYVMKEVSSRLSEK